MQPDSRARLKQWLESGEARLQPLSYPQRELWENSPVPVASPANHICCYIEIKGALTEKDTFDSLQRVVDRQEALRISFLPGKDRPLQLVRSTGSTLLACRELSGTEKNPEALEEVLSETYRKPFDMMQGPLHRVDMLRRDTNDHILAFSIHHSVADGWSLGVFVQDLCTAYVMGLSTLKKAVASGVMGLRSSLPPVPQTYTEWAAADRAQWSPEVIAPHADYWKTKLAGARMIWPADAARAQEPLQRWATEIPAELTAAVRELARRSGATLFSTLLSMFQIALSKWRGQEDIVVGTPVANRARAAARETMGYFAGVVPLRGQVDPAMPFRDHLKATHEMAMDGFGHAIPFAEIAAAVGEPRAKGLHSIFDVRFALQNHPTPDVVLPRISTKLRMRSTGTARFDLGCEITEIGTELEVVWLFKQSIFSKETIAAMNTLFQTVVTRCCRDSGGRVSGLTA